MTCQEAKEHFPLLLYGELSFDDEELMEAHLDACDACRGELLRERSMHQSLDAVELRPTPEMLAQCREQLRASLQTAPARRGFFARWLQGFTIHVHPIPSVMQPVGALALLAMGFFGARMLPPAMLGVNTQNAGLMSPVTSRVRYVEPEQSGKVKMVVEEIHERSFTGSLDDQKIQNLLLAAARDPQDAGLRVESVDLLKASPETPEVRNALLYALQHDPNPGVRLKALEGLKGSTTDAQVRKALTQALLTDTNPGVRTQAIDLLIQHKEDQMVGVLQELMRREDNGYVRLRCQKALQEMNASVETY